METIWAYLVSLQKCVARGQIPLEYNESGIELGGNIVRTIRRMEQVKRECYLAGRVPAARCNMENIASKATLLKAGLAIAGYMLIGEVKR